VCVVIINDGLSDSFISAVRNNESALLSIDFYNIKDDIRADLFKTDFKNPVYWRLIAPCIVEDDVKAILYLDADIIIRKDISEIFDYDLAGSIAGACVDYLDKISLGISNWKELGLEENKPYFNAGVLLIDTKKYREEDIANKVFSIVQNNRDHLIAGSKWPQNDQYGLNVALYGKWTILPQTYNYGSELPLDLNAKVVHFIGNGKPGSKTCNDVYASEFFSYLNTK